ncbi:MAG: 6-carboxytetrahydropterin synthase [Myxococcota bacterium]|nr:6-carboxytetrahydropterin synthase [Myxococcota bacterium]
MGTFTSSKTFRGFPCAHRRWRHAGHCAHVHGYDRTFTVWFAAHTRTENGFVMDFGQLKPVKAWLETHFDHTLLLDRDDPLLADFQALEIQGACRIVTFDDVGMEGTAEFVYQWVNTWVQEVTEQRVWVTSVEVRENEKNSARFTPESC